MLTGDTIAAISSAVGVAPRMIIRLSGPKTFTIVRNFVMPLTPSRGVTRVTIDLDGSPLPAWAYAFIAPNSYTAEDSLELHIPGNPVIAARLLAICLAQGARAAEPGEFTARAYFNGRLDLTQAEGVAAIVSAQGAADLAAARRLLGGELSTRLRPLLDRLTETLALIELAIDFSEEDVDFASPAILAKRLTAITADFDAITNEGARLRPLSRQPVVVLFGRPNAGKSTLLNALAGHERAVVSPIAGTTRDVLSENVTLSRGTIELQDAAGLAAGEDADDLARQMRVRALAAIAAADIAVRIEDATYASSPIDAGRVADLVVRTKIDLITPANPLAAERLSLKHQPPVMSVSAVTGDGIAALRERLDTLAFGSLAPAASLSLTARHLDALAIAREALGRADPASPLELLAGDLRDAIDALGSIIGTVAPDDVLAKIFGTFCIGK